MKRQNVILALLFILVISFLGFISDYKLLDYYINDIQYNEYWNPSLGRKNETEYSTVFFGKRTFVDLNGAIRHVLGQHEMNNVCRLNNNQLTALAPEIPSELLKENAENICKLYTYCEKQNIKFIYVSAPDKISPIDPELPIGEIDYSNSNIDCFLEYLNEFGVPFIDLRKCYINDGIDHYTQFSKTDHHWNGFAGYYAFTKIYEWMYQNGIILDSTAFDEKNYNIIQYENKLLGSWGQRTGKLFAGADKFIVYYPKFTTSVTAGDITGSYEDVLLNDDLLNNKEPSFIYDDFYQNTFNIVNNIVENESNILLISDSFSRVVNPFLILSCKYFEWYSTYASYVVTSDFIDSYSPDVIVLLQSPYNNYELKDSYSFLPDIQ